MAQVKPGRGVVQETLLEFEVICKDGKAGHPGLIGYGSILPDAIAAMLNKQQACRQVTGCLFFLARTRVMTSV